jgi:hypothetical protein
VLFKSVPFLVKNEIVYFDSEISQLFQESFYHLQNGLLEILHLHSLIGGDRPKDVAYNVSLMLCSEFWFIFYTVSQITVNKQKL